jgi:hypothetical protein
MPLKSGDGQVLVDPAVLALPVPEPDPMLRSRPEPQQACPSGHQNALGMKFCGECGASLEAPRKWACGHDNAEQNKFCGECGQPAYAPPVSGAGFLAEAGAQPGLSLPPARPKPEALLTPEEKAERRRQHEEAVRLGSHMPEPKYEIPDGSVPEQVVHFIADGLTWAGECWFRGQTMRLPIGSARWQQAQSWINQTDFEQVDHYGEVKFRPGPWPGKSYVDALAEQQRPLAVIGGTGQVSLPTEEELMAAQRREESRRGAVPALSY